MRERTASFPRKLMDNCDALTEPQGLFSITGGFVRLRYDDCIIQVAVISVDNLQQTERGCYDK